MIRLLLSAFVVDCWALNDAMTNRRYGWAVIFVVGALGLCTCSGWLALSENRAYDPLVDVTAHRSRPGRAG